LSCSGASLSDAGRQYSQASSAALKKLDSLDAKVEGISGRVENVVSSLSSSVAEAEDVTPLLKAKNELAQIMGDLEKLQFREVAAC
jgi:DNA-binding transcriptional LysR family regulator